MMHVLFISSDVAAEAVIWICFFEKVWLGVEFQILRDFILLKYATLEVHF